MFPGSHDVRDPIITRTSLLAWLGTCLRRGGGGTDRGKREGEDGKGKDGGREEEGGGGGREVEEEWGEAGERIDQKEERGRR